MVKYLITESEKTALESKICEIAGVSGPLEFPDGFANTINTMVFPPFYSITMILNSNFISTFITDDITLLRSYAFDGIDKLQIINLPNCSNIGNNAFYNCTGLVAAYFSKLENINNHAFDYCEKLVSLYLMSTSMVQVSSVSTTFFYTPLYNYSAQAGQYGSIFVPSSLLTAYQTDTNWGQISERFVGV